jgi:hypothetical protein
MGVARIPKMLAGGPEKSYFPFGAKTALKERFWNNEPRPTAVTRGFLEIDFRSFFTQDSG